MKNIKSINALTPEKIARYAPSALATTPMPGVSDKYSFVSTMDAVELIQSLGWMPYWADEANVRKDDKEGFQRHIIKFTMGQALTEVGQERIDLLLYNSHDRGSAFKLAMGIYRLVCSNGLVVGDDRLSFSHKHIGFDESAFLDSVRAIANNGHKIASKVDDFKSIEMAPNEQGIYAAAAAELITEDVKEINLPDLLTARRWDDRRANDLWTTYNRVQENIIKGGVRRVGRTESGRRKKRLRAVKSIEKDVRLNKALWTLTEKMAEIKGKNPTAMGF